MGAKETVSWLGHFLCSHCLSQSLLRDDGFSATGCLTVCLACHLILLVPCLAYSVLLKMEAVCFQNIGLTLNHTVLPYSSCMPLLIYKPAPLDNPPCVKVSGTSFQTYNQIFLHFLFHFYKEILGSPWST